MAQKKVDVLGIGEVVLQKRRGTKNLRLSLNAEGQVKVGLPAWTPYAVGISFVRSKKGWIEKHRQKVSPKGMINGGLIGKAHRLRYEQVQNLGAKITTRVTSSEVIIRSGMPFMQPAVQAKARQAGERALKQQAEKLLPQKLEQLARKFGYEYQSVSIKKLTSRWGSCSSKKHITLNFFLVQLPWDLIDYVILHELAHTKHLNHSSSFWEEVGRTYPEYKQARKRIKQYSPSTSTINT